MENYFYNCDKCGFVHLIPAYWVDFRPESEMELIHINLKTGEQCINTRLLLKDESK